MPAIEQKKIIIPLDEKSHSVLVGIVGKYKLQENMEDILKKAKEHTSFNEAVLIKLTRDFMLEKLSNKQFLDALHESFKTPKETTKNIALDIINNLIPTLEKIPEDKLAEHNRAKQLKESALQQAKENLEEEKNKQKEVEATKEKNKDEDEEQAKKDAFKRAKEELMQKIGAKKSVPEPVEKEAPVPYKKGPNVTNVEENAKKIEQERKPMASSNEKPVAPPAPAPEKKVDPYKETIE